MVAKRVFRPAFTILEVVAALTLLAMICATTLIVLERCMKSTIDSELKMQAFKAARENMEKLLANQTVELMVEFGTLEENPNIDWQMVVEPFNEPATSKMWIRGVCTASYKDSTGEMQNFELKSWITDLTDAQVKKLLDQMQREKEFIEETGENPFGDDAPGLLKWANRLASMGDLQGAIEVAEQIIIEFPDSREAEMAMSALQKWKYYILHPQKWEQITKTEIDPEIDPTTKTPEEIIPETEEPDRPLTRQERLDKQVLIWIAEGKTLPEIFPLMLQYE